MSKENRRRAAYAREENKKFTAEFKAFNLDEVPMIPNLAAVWRNNRFLVQMFTPAGGGQRLSINRTMVDDRTGDWIDGITWDEIQTIKHQLGFGERTAIEIYPPDEDLVNVASIRHIWLVDKAPAFLWKKGPPCEELAA